MRSRKIALISCLAITSIVANAQVVKNKIGFSTWTYNGQTIADSVLTFIMTYDSAGRLNIEHRKLLDTNGYKIDSIYSKIDTLGRYYFYKNKDSQHFAQYDSLGEINYSKYSYTIGLGTNKAEPKEIIQNHINEYNDKAKIIKSTITSNAEYAVDQTTTYKYLGRWRIENKEFVKVYTRTNRDNKTTYNLTIVSSPASSDVGLKWSYRYKRNRNNEVKKFIEKREGKKYKTTQSYYVKQKEVRREEVFYETGIKATTSFKYLYY